MSTDHEQKRIRHAFIAEVPIFCVNKNLEVEDHLFSNLLSFLLVP